MKKVLAILALVAVCLAPASSAHAARHKQSHFQDKETTVDMSGMKRIFIGWVDMHADDWAAQGYTTRQEWVDTITLLNASFVANLMQSDLPNRTLVPAKNKDDEDARGCDLFVKFTDVKVDYDNYRLTLAIHFIDPKTGQEIGSVGAYSYSGRTTGPRGSLEVALQQVGQKLKREITGQTQP